MPVQVAVTARDALGNPTLRAGDGGGRAQVQYSHLSTLRAWKCMVSSTLEPINRLYDLLVCKLCFHKRNFVALRDGAKLSVSVCALADAAAAAAAAAASGAFVGRFAFTPGCPVGYMDRTVFWLSSAWLSSLEPCFKRCKIT
jgi:hypothetical protein